MRKRFDVLLRAGMGRLGRLLHVALIEESRRQALAIARLELLVRRIDRRVAPARVTLRRRIRAPRAGGNGASAAHPDSAKPELLLPSGPTLDLAACPLCGHGQWTAVCEYNKFLLLDVGVDAEACRYDYSLCHRCGVVFARRRPAGDRYRSLLERFELVLGRAGDLDATRRNVGRTSAALDERVRDDIRRRLAHGIFVSELSGLRRREYVPQLQEDRLANSAHVELLGSLLPLRAPRVLELRPRLGAIGAALQRLYGAEVCAMPLFETQQLLIAEAYGIRCDHRLDFDDFRIPYDGCFDLVVANHVLTHAVHPARLLAAVRERLRPGGHVYLYNESDEADVLVGGKLLFNALNAFHFQIFTAASLARSVAACGFEPVFASRHDGRLLMLASAADDAPEWDRMRKPERVRRVAAYRHARDRAILRVPPRIQQRFTAEWDDVVRRSVVAGAADYDDRGRPRLVKRVGAARR